MFYLEEHPPKVTIVWETNWEEERLLGQTACSHAGVPPLLPSWSWPAARSCTTTIKKRSSLLPPLSFLRSQPAYNNDSGGGNNGLCDVTTDGGRMLSSLPPVHELISLSLAVSGMKADRVTRPWSTIPYANM